MNKLYLCLAWLLIKTEQASKAEVVHQLGVSNLEKKIGQNSYWPAQTDKLFLKVGTPNFGPILQIHRRLEFTNLKDHPTLNAVKLVHHDDRKFSSSTRTRTRTQNGCISLELFGIGQAVRAWYHR